MATIGAKIKELRTASGSTREAFALLLGEKPSKIQDIESGRQRVNDEFLRKLIEHFQVDLNWLFDVSGFGGDGSPRIEKPDQSRPLAGHFNADGEDYSLIRRLDLSVSAGNGLVPVTDGIVERVAFSRTWLLRNRLTADLCVLVRVKGDSMTPSIPDGALALINCAERWSTTPGVYAFTRDGEAYIKRVAPLSLGRDGRPTALIIASDNPDYPTETLLGPDLAGYKPVGKVHTVITTLL